MLDDPHLRLRAHRFFHCWLACRCCYLLAQLQTLNQLRWLVCDGFALQRHGNRVTAIVDYRTIEQMLLPAIANANNKRCGWWINAHIQQLHSMRLGASVFHVISNDPRITTNFLPVP